VLNTPGGTYDLRTGEHRGHSPQDFITKVAGTTPDASMRAPVWNTFLDRITGGNADLILFLRRMAGYSLTGSTEEHALFFLYVGRAYRQSETILSEPRSKGLCVVQILSRRQRI